METTANAAVGIIIVAHTDYAAALLRTTEFILGPLGDCTSISVDAAFDVADTAQRLNDAAQLLDQGGCGHATRKRRHPFPRGHEEIYLKQLKCQ
jgi:hypothetical protein